MSSSLITNLPTEVFDNILEFAGAAIPRDGAIGSWRERYVVLPIASLVCRAWREPAQAALWSKVELQHASITSLSLCYPEGGSLYTSPGQPATYTFTLSSLSLTHRPDFSLEALQSLLQPSLNSLRLDIVHYSARTEDFHLLSLQDALLPALTPLLPHLSSLTLALDSRLSERIRAPLWPALASCTSFKNYGLTILQAEEVNPVPVPLHTFAALKFSVASGTASGRELLALLRGGSTALEKLKKLRIEVEEQDFRSLAESEAILSHCQQRGIEVDLFRDWD